MGKLRNYYSKQRDHTGSYRRLHQSHILFGGSLFCEGLGRPGRKVKIGGQDGEYNIQYGDSQECLWVRNHIFHYFSTISKHYSGKMQ